MAGPSTLLVNVVCEWPFTLILVSLGTRVKALEKLSAIKARDGFSENLTRSEVAQVYQGLNGINGSTFLNNIYNLQVFWGQKEITRALKAPTFMDDVNKLGFDTSLVMTFLL